MRLKDIAEDLGLSVMTISRALRSSPDIAAATQKKVLKRMRDLNYYPNLPARSLRGSRTWTLGIVLPTLLDPSIVRIANAIASEVRQRGYSLLISSSDGDLNVELRELKQLLARRVDVVVLAWMLRTAECMQVVEAQKTPCVLVDGCFQNSNANFVGMEDEAVGMVATVHLMEEGCRNIAHVGDSGGDASVRRLQGYRRALDSQKIRPLPEHIVYLGESRGLRGENAGYEAAKRLLATQPVPDGICCVDDLSAIGVMRATLNAGLRIPEDVAVVGCGNLLFADLLPVPLSSVDLRRDLIGRRAAELALKLAAGEIEARSVKEMIRPKVIMRSSSTRLRVTRRRSQLSTVNKSG